MPRRGQHHSPAALGPGGSISRGTRFGQRKVKALEAQNAQLLAALYSAGPSEIEAYRRTGVPSSPSVMLAADVAAATITRLRRAVEGEPAPGAHHPPRPLSPQRVARLGHAQRLLTLGIALELRALTADDREAASSAGTLIRAADSIITDTLGMDLEAEVQSLAAYLAARREAPATAASAANGSTPEPQAADAEIAAQNATQESAE